jgi:putative transposase
MLATDEKKQKIRDAIKLTREKRSSQVCRVFETKIDISHLNKYEQEHLKMFFVEAKWLYNHVLNQQDVFKYDYKINPIQRMDKEHNLVDIELKHLPAKCRQNVVQGLQQNIKSLSAKKKTSKVGRLKFKSDFNCIELNQFGVTHKIINKNKIKLNGFKKPIRVHGLEQIKEGYEIANAKLLKKPDGYYVNFTTYHFPKGEIENKIKKECVGLDFGIKNNITTSEGEIFNVCVEESGRLKRLQRKFSKSKKGSNNRYYLRKLIQIEYQKITNKKKDKANKIVNYLLKNYHQVFIQDENLQGWQRKWFGKQIQHSAMGAIKSKLISSNQVHVIGRFEPTTKMCPNCGTVKDKVALSERVFKCDCCGYENDRDIKAAITIMKLGKIQIGVERTNFKPAEKQSSLLNDVSIKQEAKSPLGLGSSL